MPTVTIETDEDEENEVSGRPPTDAQKRALQRFLDNEERICQELLETLVRYVAVISEQSGGFFDDFSDIRSRTDLCDVIEFAGLSVMTREQDGEAVLSLDFDCDWDPEHGLGVALHKGLVVDIGPSGEVGLATDGRFVPREIFNKEQLAAWNALFGDSVRKQEAQMEASAEKHQEQQQRTLQAVLEDGRYGPAVREFTRLLLDHPRRGMDLTLDVRPTTAPPETSLEVAAELEKFMQGMGSLEGTPVEGLADRMQEMMRSATQPPPPVVEVFLWLGDQRAMWHYAGQVRTDRIDAGPWPEILEALASKWPGARPRPESVAILKIDIQKGKKDVERDSPLRAAAIAAICEVFGIEPPSEADSNRLLDPLELLKSGPDGVEQWNALSDSQRKNGGPYEQADLSHAVLEGANLASLNFQQSCFDSARMIAANMTAGKFQKSTFRKARLEGCETFDANFQECDFTQADLRGLTFYGVNLRRACFHQADLRGAKINLSDVRGADFSTALLDENVFLGFTEFDAKTKFPEGFEYPEPDRLKWAGKGPPPGT